MSSNVKRGVTPQTFKRMVKIVEIQEKAKKKSGRPSKLSLENQILMTARIFTRIQNLFSEGVILGSPRDVLTARIILVNLGD